jgi:hypothetical protein
MSSARREPHSWLGGSRREKLLGGQIMFADASIQMYESRRLMRMLSCDTGLCAHRLWRRPRGLIFLGSAFRWNRARVRLDGDAGRAHLIAV